MPIQFSDEQIARFANEGVAKAMTEQFTSRYSHGEALTKAIQKAIKDQEHVIAAALQAAIATACHSDAFKAAVSAELVGVVRRKFTGEFDGVVKAAAKRAALDATVNARIAQALAAAGQEKGI